MEHSRFIGVGVSLVDYVFIGQDHGFPADRGEVLPYITTNRADVIRAGGPMPNTFTAISYMLKNRRLKLFHCVGPDSRGHLFQKETIPEIGLPQIHPIEPTGVWAGFISDSGKLRFGLSYYGAALKVRVTREDLAQEPNGVFVTDISSCKSDDINSQMDIILEQLDKDGGIFALSLGGARSSSLSTDKLTSVINSLKYEPQIVFSNVEELRYTTRIEEVDSAIWSLFPNARLAVVTDGENGSMIRFEDQILRIPALLTGNIKDETGAGDAYMGVMLGGLFNYPYKEWGANLIKRNGEAAAFAASRLVTTSSVRLGREAAQIVLDYLAY